MHHNDLIYLYFSSGRSRSKSEVKTQKARKVFLYSLLNRKENLRGILNKAENNGLGRRGKRALKGLSDMFTPKDRYQKGGNAQLKELKGHA